MTTEAKTQARPIQADMLDLITGYWISCGVHVAARLAVADHLAGGPRTADDLARASQSDAPTLHRLLRMLASAGVFREGADGRFENTPLSETLRSDAPGSMRGFARMMVDGYNLHAWADLLECVKTGESAFPRVFGERAFDWFARHPQQAKEFGDSMTSISAMEVPAIAAAYDFSAFAKLIDVGGGHGSLMSAILEKTPKLRGVVYDRPEVVANARTDATARASGIADRLELVEGDFFESIPAGADAVIMKYILHDWEDELCVKILSNCRRAMGPEGRVLVVDNVIPPGNDPQWGKKLDINMLVLTGGRERTQEDFARLFQESGFRLERVVPTACPLSVVEGVARGG
jgi:SAM-dependent methyltransferase